MEKVFEPEARGLEGNLEADLSHLGNQSSGGVYLKLRPPSNTGTFLGPSENPPISTWSGKDDTNFHFWVTAPLGNNWRSVLLAGENNPPIVSICGDGTGAEFYKEWELKEGIVTATPTFTHNITGRVGPMIQIDPVSSGTKITATSPLNSITNAVGIVILNAPEQPAMTNTTMVAITKYSPASLNLTPTDSRITWAIDQDHRGPGPAGDAGFLSDKKNGTVVHVYGKTEGRVILSATLQDPTVGQLAESYEAEVVKEKIIPFRVNLFRSATHRKGEIVQTVIHEQQAAEHIAIANIYLRQFGIRLVPDSNTTVFGNNPFNHTRLLKPGFFRSIVTDTNLVKGVTFPENAERAIQINDDPGVVQITYVESADNPSALGETVDWPGNSNLPGNANGTISLNYRITVDDISAKHKMNMYGPQLQSNSNIWGMLIFNGLGNPILNTQRFANTIAHEMGHVMNLGHRGVPGDPFDDGLVPPGIPNLMYPVNTPMRADLDLIQLEGARGSRALKP